MSEANLGLALDLGTTTLAGRLIDGTGAKVAEARCANPQVQFGGDIVRRLEVSLDGAGSRLQTLLVEGVETLLGELLAQAGCLRDRIGAAAAAGNPGICHLLRNLPVNSILFPPHRPAEGRGVFLDPSRLGLDLGVPLYLFPLVSGYVGGDLVAFLFSFREHSPGSIFLDIGTNGEMALFAGGSWLATSVAAGPAFEGGGVMCGMPAQRGAVEKVRLQGDRLRLEVIGGGPARGVCGSGLAEAIAAGLEGGLIDRWGGIVEPSAVPNNLARYLAETPSGRALRLYRDAASDLLLTQEDIRNFQLAKGAIRAGVDCLLQRSGQRPEEIEKVFLTGAFGFSLAPQILKRVAMLPSNMVNKVRFVPGGALEGVCRLLGDPLGPGRVQALADALKPFPLSGTPAFEKAFLSALDF